MQYVVRVNDIPQVSLNQIYKGIHWDARRRYKDEWRAAFTGWHTQKFTTPVHITYVFEQKYVMDSSNLAFMVKLIEDSLVEDQVIQNDDPNFVLSTHMIPVKSKRNSVTVFITDEEPLSYLDHVKTATEYNAKN